MSALPPGARPIRCPDCQQPVLTVEGDCVVIVGRHKGERHTVVLDGLEFLLFLVQSLPPEYLRLLRAMRPPV